MENSLPGHMVPPSCVELNDSLVVKGMQGIICKEAISIDTKFGPFIGEIISSSELDKQEINFRYAWLVTDDKTGKDLHVLNASNPEKGNWMRYVNSARFFEEQNILSVQEGTDIYYKAIKDIKPGEELLTWFDLPLADKKRSHKRKQSTQNYELMPTSEKLSSVNEFESGSGKRLRKKKFDADMLSVDDHDVIFASSGHHHNRVKTGSSSAVRRYSSNHGSRMNQSQKIERSKSDPYSKMVISASQESVSASQQTDLLGIGENKTISGSAQIFVPHVRQPVKNTKRPKTILQIVDALKSAKQESNDSSLKLVEEIVISDTEDISDVNVFTGVKQQKRSHLVGTAEFMEEHLTTNYQFLFEVTPAFKYFPNGASKHFKYACDICDGQYWKPINLKRHYLREHLNHKYLSLEDVSLLSQKNASAKDGVEADADPDADDQDGESALDAMESTNEHCNNVELKIKKEILDTCAAQIPVQDEKEGSLPTKDGDSVSRLKTNVEDLEKNLKSKHLDGKTAFSYSGLDDVDDAFRCHLCVQLFPSVEKLRLHLSNDSHRSKIDKQFSCERCNQRFRFRYNYQRHVEAHGIHTKELSTACHICGKKFMNEANMRKHLRFHSGRNFPCKYGCDVVYPNVAELVKHLRALHPNLPKRSQLMGINSTNVSKKHLGLQQRSNDLSASSATMLEKSGAVHKHKISMPGSSGARNQKAQNSKPGAQCPVCKKRFSTYGSMSRHRRTFHRFAKPSEKVKGVVSKVDTLPDKVVEENGAVLENQTTQPVVSVEARVELWYKSIEEELARKDALDGQFVFSPPPSPTSFYQNVADNVAENLSCYLDGGSQALENARQYIKVDNYVAIDDVQEVLSDTVIDWSTYNFPPFFMPVDPVIPNPPSPPRPPPSLTEGIAYTTRSAVAEREATWRATAEAIEGPSTEQKNIVTRRASFGALDGKAKNLEKTVRRASFGSFENKGNGDGESRHITDVTEKSKMNSVDQKAPWCEKALWDKGTKQDSGPEALASSCQESETVSTELIGSAFNEKTNPGVEESNEVFGTIKRMESKSNACSPVAKAGSVEIAHTRDSPAEMKTDQKTYCDAALTSQEGVSFCRDEQELLNISSEVNTHSSSLLHCDLSSTTDTTEAKELDLLNVSVAESSCQKSPDADFTKRSEPGCDSSYEMEKINESAEKISNNLDEQSVSTPHDTASNEANMSIDSDGALHTKGEVDLASEIVEPGLHLTDKLENESQNMNCVKVTDEEQSHLKAEISKELTKADNTCSKPEHIAPMRMGKPFDSSVPSALSSENSGRDLSEKELECLAKGIVMYVRGNQKGCHHDVNTSSVAARQPKDKDEEEYLNTLQLTTKRVKPDSHSETTDKIPLNGLTSATSAVNSKDLTPSMDGEEKSPELKPSDVGDSGADPVCGIAESSETKLESSQVVTSLVDMQPDLVSERKAESEVPQAESSLITKETSISQHLATKLQGSSVTSGSESAENQDDIDLDLELVMLQSKTATQVLQEKVTIDHEAEEFCAQCRLQNTEHGEPSKRTAEDFANMRFGRKYPIFTVCSLCRRYYYGVDSLLRHQMKKHPSIQCSHFEVENGHGLERLFYPEPSSQGVLAQSVLMPPHTLNQETYTCTRCKLTVKQYSRLRAHILNCDPKTPTTPHTRKKKHKVNRHRFMEKMLPDSSFGNEQVKPVGGAVRELSFKSKSQGGFGLNKTFPITTKIEKLVNLPPKKDGTKSAKSQPSGRTSTSVRTRVPSWKVKQSQLSLSANKSNLSSGKSGRARCRNYELLYNPAAHVRRRERTDCVDIHQCQGCRLSFKTLFLLERHTKNCSGKDKIRSQNSITNRLHEDDGASKHSCHYCPKRFKYLRGVQNHYSNFCRVRMERLSGAGLSAEDLAHEKDIQVRLQQQAWHKMENRDHTDVIQGRAQVLDDGTIAHSKHKRGWPKGQKRSSKRRCNGWTSIKRRKSETSNNETSSRQSKSKSTSSLKSQVSSNSAISIALSELQAQLKRPGKQSMAEGSRESAALSQDDVVSKTVSTAGYVKKRACHAKGKKCGKVLDDLSEAPIIDRMDILPPIRTKDGKQMSPDLEPPTLSPIPPPESETVTPPQSGNEKKKRKRKTVESLLAKRSKKNTVASQPIIAPKVNLGEGVSSPLLLVEQVTDATGAKTSQLQVFQLKIPTVVPSQASQVSAVQTTAGSKNITNKKSTITDFVNSQFVTEKQRVPLKVFLPSPEKKGSDVDGEENESGPSSTVGNLKSGQDIPLKLSQEGEAQGNTSRRLKSQKNTTIVNSPTQTTIKDVFQTKKSPTRSRNHAKTLKNMNVYRYEKCPVGTTTQSQTQLSTVVSLASSGTSSTVQLPTTSASLLSESGVSVLPPGTVLAVLPTAPIVLQSPMAQAKTTMALPSPMQTNLAESKVVILDPRSLSGLTSASSFQAAASPAHDSGKKRKMLPADLATSSPTASVSPPDSNLPSQTPNTDLARKTSVSKPAKLAAHLEGVKETSGDVSLKEKKEEGKKNVAEDVGHTKSKGKDMQVVGKVEDSTAGTQEEKRKPKRGPPPSAKSHSGKVKSMIMMTSPGVHTMVSLNAPSSPASKRQASGKRRFSATYNEGISSKETTSTCNAVSLQESQTRPTRVTKRKRNQKQTINQTNECKETKDCGVVGNGHVSTAENEQSDKQSKGAGEGAVVLNIPVIEKKGEKHVTPGSKPANEDLPLGPSTNKKRKCQAKNKRQMKQTKARKR